MILVPEGPDVPVRLLEALEDGQLVFVCGAGISRPAKLPLFSGLVDRVYKELGAVPTEAEAAELSSENYDRVLGLLEGDGRYSPSQVRQAVCRILKSPPNPPIETHRALIDLSRDPEGRVRLVTTNFDLLFEAADPSVPFTAAPLLPVPKPEKWDGVVYLHGRIDEESDPDGQHLVLTSADFGVAYLLERWASRFVTELFNHFAVLFVGYRVGDPVMRYLIDALAAERRRGNRVRDAYALASYDESNHREKVQSEWRAKNVIPILYDAVDAHRLLHDTLQAWAGLWRGGLTSKRDTLRELGRLDPRGLSPEQISQFCWALSDASVAGELATLGTDVPFEWVAVLEREGVLDQFEKGRSGRGALCDGGMTTASPVGLSPGASALGGWLARHSANPELAKWVVGKGGHLHPWFADAIRRELDDESKAAGIPDALKKVWRAITGAVDLAGPNDWVDQRHLLDRLVSEPWSPALRRDLLSALSPLIAVGPRWGSSVSLEDSEVEAGASGEAKELSVSEIVRVDCELVAGNLRGEIVARLQSRPDSSTILADLVFDLTGLLRAALDMQAVLDRATNDYDLSHHERPSIEPHPQNHGFNGWTTLIDLVRAGFSELAARNPRAAQGLIEIWKSVPYPLFRRLLLHAARVTTMVQGNDIFELIASDARHWLWAVGVQVELFRLLPSLCESLNEGSKRSLLQIVRAGPPRDLFRDELGDEEWELIRDRSIWEILVRLNRAPCRLEGDDLEALREIEGRFTEWKFQGTDREDFPTWSETRWGLESDYSAEALAAMPDDEILRVLAEHQDNRAGLLDNWRQVAAHDQVRAVRLLERMAATDQFDRLVWHQALGAFREVSEDPPFRDALLGVLESLPDSLVREVIDPLSATISALAKSIPDSARCRLLALWDRAVPAAVAISRRVENQDRLTQAINHPIGTLAEALLRTLRSRKLTRGEGIAPDVRTRLEELIGLGGEPGQLARVLICSRVGLLHDLDGDWTAEKVIPLFSWGDAVEARGAWRGFLWSAWLSQGLWGPLKDDFLTAFDHLGELGEASRILCQLVPAAAIDGAGALSPDEARSCLRRMDDEGRAAAAWWIARKMDNVGDRSETLWHDRIGPWIAQAWPKEPSLRTERISTEFARIAVLARDAFPDAVNVVGPLLVGIRWGRNFLEDLEEHGHIASHPAAALDLVDRLVGDSPDPWFGDVGLFLSRVASADSQLQADPRFKRLKDIAVRAQLRS